MPTLEPVSIRATLETILRRADRDLYQDRITLADAKKTWWDFRIASGFKSATEILTRAGNNPKMAKNRIPTLGMHLSPSDGSGIINVCPLATAGCRDACLNTAGRGVMRVVQDGRVSKTRFAANHPTEFLVILMAEIASARRRLGQIAIRLNATSDIRWERVTPWMFARFADIQFYDYTKYAPKARRDLARNYDMTYSISERHSIDDIRDLVADGHRVAVVIDTPMSRNLGALPTTWHGMSAIDGDLSDYRPDDPISVVLLRAKGDARHDTTGFVFPTFERI